MSAIHLLSSLQQFTGTTTYHKLYPKIILTDGAKFLAEQANCFWLMDIYASHLLCAIDEVETFTCLSMVVEEHQANIIIEDGNGVVLAMQTIEFTDFPLSQMKLFACFDGTYWVIMLTSEY